MPDYARFELNWKYICEPSVFYEVYHRQRRAKEFTYELNEITKGSACKAYLILYEKIKILCFPSFTKAPSPKVGSKRAYARRQHFINSRSSPFPSLRICFSPIIINSSGEVHEENNSSLTENVMAIIFCPYFPLCVIR